MEFKNMNKIIKIHIALLLSLIPWISFSQTNDTIKKTLNESVIIKAQFDPVINDAYKILESPNIIDTSFAVPNFSYEIINKIFPVKMEIEGINPAKVKGEPLDMLYNGNIKAGIGTYLTPYIDLSYGETRNRTLIYSAQMRHYSSFWSIADYGKSHFSNTDINLYAKKLWDRFAVDARLYYDNSQNYYYGFLKDSVPMESKDYKMSWNNIGFQANYSSLYRNDKSLHHKISFFVENLSGKYGLKETSIGLNADGNKKFRLFGNDMQKIGLNIDYTQRFDAFEISFDSLAPFFAPPNPLYERTPGSKYNSGLASIKPYMDFKVKKFELHTALAFVPEFGRESNFHVLPTAIVNFPIINQKLFFKGGLNSIAERVSLNYYRKENPYISPYQDLEITKKNQIFAGLNSNLFPNLSFGAELGYEYYFNHHFYDIDPYANYNNMFRIIYDDASRFYAKANISYNYQKSFRIEGEVVYQDYITDSLSFAYYKPKFMASMSLEYIPAEKLVFSLNPIFKSKSKTMVLNKEVELSPIIDINLSVEYKYSDQARFFLRLNNLAFQRYQYYYNYPSQRFMGMIGLSFSF